jgi:UDP-glucose 4-epimerase
MKRYLVTGAAGFIGSAVARSLIAQNNMVISVDNLSTGKRENIPSGCIFFEGNTFDSRVLDKLRVYKFDAILHIAGQSSGEVSFEDPVYDLQTNTQSTLCLLEMAKKQNCKKFIFTSSMAVYGDYIGPPPHSQVSEDVRPIPKSFYAVGKLASENYMRIYSAFGLECIALRLFNIYGKGQNLDNLKQGMASIYLAMAINNKKITVKGTKDRFRDFVYIDDVVAAINLLLASSSPIQDAFKVYNVCTGKKTTVETIINFIQNKLPFSIDVEYVAGTLGDQNGIIGSYEEIQHDLAWVPRYSFDKGMNKMIQWALEKSKEGENQ